MSAEKNTRKSKQKIKNKVISEDESLSVFLIDMNFERKPLPPKGSSEGKSYSASIDYFKPRSEPYTFATCISTFEAKAHTASDDYISVKASYIVMFDPKSEDVNFIADRASDIVQLAAWNQFRDLYNFLAHQSRIEVPILSSSPRITWACDVDEEK